LNRFIKVMIVRGTRQLSQSEEKEASLERARQSGSNKKWPDRRRVSY